MASNSSALPRVTFQTPEKPGEESSHRKLGKLTIKYNRKDLQRWLDLEEWINAQLQELYQCRLREETEAAAPEPQIDLEDLLEVPNEEQKLKLQEILHECSSPTEAKTHTFTLGILNPVPLKDHSNLTAESVKKLKGLTEKKCMILGIYFQNMLWQPLITQDFITELLSRLRGLRRVTNPQKK